MSRFNSNICRLYKWAKLVPFASWLATGASRVARLSILDPLLPQGQAYPRASGECSTSIAYPVPSIDLSTLNCRVRLTKQPRTNCPSNSKAQRPGTAISGGDVFTIEIVGSIRAASDSDYATIAIQIMDVTDGLQKFEIRNSKFSTGRLTAEISAEGEPFCYRADLGRLVNKVTTLTDWTAVAHLDPGWLLFPRKGKRVLQFNVSVLSGPAPIVPSPAAQACDKPDPVVGGQLVRGQELAQAQCLCAYENSAFGYLDLQENTDRTKSLAVALAFAVSAIDNKLYHSEVQLIKDWARTNLCENSKPQPVNWKLEEALDRAVSFFQKGNQLDVREVCREIVEIAPLSDRYDILDLCLRVTRAKGSAAPEELTALQYIAIWLEVDMDRFGAMMEKLLPVNIHQVKDAKVVLGLKCDMSKERTRRQLNREYGKWNSRVTNANPEIQAQADQMLKLIAEARSQLIADCRLSNAN